MVNQHKRTTCVGAKYKKSECFVWLGFSVFFALLPLLLEHLQRLSYIAQTNDVMACVFKTVELISPRGELFLLTIGMTTAAMGRLLTVETDKKASSRIILFLAFTIVFVCGYSYGHLPKDSVVSELDLKTITYLYEAGFFVSFLCFLFTDKELIKLADEAHHYREKYNKLNTLNKKKGDRYSD